MLSDRGGRGRPAAHRRETAPPGDTGAAGATGVTKGHWVTEVACNCHRGVTRATGVAGAELPTGVAFRGPKWR